MISSNEFHGLSNRGVKVKIKSISPTVKTPKIKKIVKEMLVPQQSPQRRSAMEA